ncbi:MAG: glycosyltransferase [Clostridium sp.]
MHVMFIPSWYSNNRNKVHGSFFKEQAKALQDSGVQVTVAYNEIWPITMFGKVNEKIGLSKSYEDGLLTYRYKNYNYIPKHPLMFKSFNKRMEKLYKNIVKENGKVDVIHAQSSLWGGISARYIAKKYNIPLVITEHSSLKYGNVIKESYLPEIINSYKEADVLVAVGSGLKKELEEVTLRSDVKVIPNLIGINNIDEVYEMKNGDFTFFSLAFLEGTKGMDTLLKSFAKGFNGKRAVKLVIGGEGSQKQELISLSKELGIENQVKFTGELSRTDVSKYMNKCDSFVLASEYETFGVVYIEALACGKPIIGCYNGGAEDIITKENGYIVEKSNVDELSEAMKLMVANINEFSSEDIIKQTKDKYNRKKIASEIIDVYKHLEKGL